MKKLFSVILLSVFILSNTHSFQPTHVRVSVLSGRVSAFQPVAKHAAIVPLSGRETPMAGITFESEEEEEEEETITFERRQRQISTSSYASSSEGRERTDSSSSTVSNASSAVSMSGVIGQPHMQDLPEVEKGMKEKGVDCYFSLLSIKEKTPQAPIKKEERKIAVAARRKKRLDPKEQTE